MCGCQQDTGRSEEGSAGRLEGVLPGDTGNLSPSLACVFSKFFSDFLFYLKAGGALLNKKKD